MNLTPSHPMHSHYSEENFVSLLSTKPVMSAIERKIIALFSPLPFSMKARIVAALSQLLAKEAMQGEETLLAEDLETSKQVRKQIAEGNMDLLSEEDYWANLKSS